MLIQYAWQIWRWRPRWRSLLSEAFYYLFFDDFGRFAEQNNTPTTFPDITLHPPRLVKDKNAAAWCRFKAGAHVAAITRRDVSIREPLQTPTGEQAAVVGGWGGKKQLTEGFPRQELQLPVPLSSPHASPACCLSSLRLSGSPACSQTHNTPG